MNPPIKVNITTSDGVSTHIYDTMNEALLRTNTAVVKLLKKFNVDSLSVSYSHYDYSVEIVNLTDETPF